MSSPLVFEQNSICVAMFSRADGETFHACIAIPDDETGSNSKKVHVTNKSGGWIYEVAKNNLRTSLSLVTVVKIGTLTSTNTWEKLDGMLRQIPMTIPSEDAGDFTEFRCRVWIRQAIRSMARSGFIICHDAKAAHDEIVAFAKQNDQAVSEGLGKANYHLSSFSK